MKRSRPKLCRASLHDAQHELLFIPFEIDRPFLDALVATLGLDNPETALQRGLEMLQVAARRWERDRRAAELLDASAFRAPDFLKSWKPGRDVEGN